MSATATSYPQDHPDHSAKGLLERLRRLRQLGAPRLVIRNAQIGLVLARKGIKWSRKPGQYQMALETKYQRFG